MKERILIVVALFLFCLSAVAQEDDPSCGNPPQPPCSGDCCDIGGGGSGGPGGPGGGSGPDDGTKGPPLHPPIQIGSSSCGGAGCNPFNPYSGVVQRHITDLDVAHSVGDRQLDLTRTMVSRLDPPVKIDFDSPFGDAGNWRHSYQWDILHNTNAAGGEKIRIIYPSGRWGNFDYDDEESAHMTFLASTQERVEKNGTNYFFTFPSGTRHHFTSWYNNGTTNYRMQATIDPYSNRYEYVYSTGLLTEVRGPNTNLYVKFNYQSITNSVVPGEIEFTYADTNAYEVFLKGDFNGWTGSPMTESNGVWSITTNLANGWYGYKYFAHYPGDTNDHWITDPENEMWTYPNSNSIAVVDPYKLLASVESSDGRSVCYKYSWTSGWDMIHIMLTDATYGEGSSANYSYYHPSNDQWRTVLLHTAKDPLYGGPGRAIEYIYQTNNIYSGRIYEERSLTTSQLLARLEWSTDTNAPHYREVTSANGSVEQIEYVEQSGSIGTKSNAVGYTWTYEYFPPYDEAPVSNGMLKAAIDPMGRTTEYARTTHFGAVTSVTHSERGTRTYGYSNYDNPFYLTNTVDELGRETIYERDSLHRVIRRVYPSGEDQTFDYNQYGQVLTNTLADGVSTWIYTYDQRGRRITQTDPGGATTYYSYNSRDLLASESNALGHVTSYFYNWRGNRTNTVYPDNTQISSSYNSWGQITSRTDRAGNVTVTTYNDFGHITSVTTPSGATTSYSPDNEGRIQTISFPSGLTITNTYDAIGRKIRETYLNDNTYNEWHYDPDGVRTQINRLTYSSYTTYTPAGYIQETKDPLVRTTTYSYDIAGRRTAMTNANESVTTWLYDDADRVISVSGCSGTTSNIYDNLGRLITRISPGNITNSSEYNAAGRQISSSVNGHLVQSNRYDAIGRSIWSMGANGLILTNDLDIMGRILTTHMPDSTFTENIYSNTFLYQSIDRAGRTTTYYHDNTGRITNQIDNTTNSISYFYSLTGQMTNLTDQSGNITAFEYDEEGRMITKTYADGSEKNYDYNAAGQLTARINSATQATYYSYNPIGNLTNINYETDTDITFTYDNLNRRTSMTDAIGTTTYSYEGSCPNVISENGPFAGDTITYGYDEAKRLTNIAFLGKEVSYGYDALGRLVTAIGPEGTNAYTYVANGRMVSQLDRANGTDAIHQYDDLMRLTNLVNRLSDQSVLSSFAYTLNDADQRTSITREDGHHIDYGYDPIGQLLSAQGKNADETPRAGQTFEFEYDKTGNPVKQNRNGFLLTNSFNYLNQNVTSLWGGAMSVIGAINTREADVTVNGSDAVVLDDMTFVATNLDVAAGTNLFTAIITDPFDRKATNTSEVIVANHGYQYDSEGNLTNDSTFTYTWNNENRLIEVKDSFSGSSVMKCRYDGQGRRRERITYSDGVATTNRYVYHGWAVLAVLDGQNNTLETYTHGIDLSGGMGGAGGIGGILSMSVVSGLQSTVYYYHYDAQGNVINVTDEDEAKASTYTYSPFGQVLTKTGTFDSRYQFSTKEYDTPVHLNYYGYRYYSPELGRWLNRDPIEESGGIHVYVFVENDPIDVIDDLGLHPIPGRPPNGPGIAYHTQCMGGHKHIWMGRSWRTQKCPPPPPPPPTTCAGKHKQCIKNADDYYKGCMLRWKVACFVICKLAKKNPIYKPACYVCKAGKGTCYIARKCDKKWCAEKKNECDDPCYKPKKRYRFCGTGSNPWP